MREAAPLNAPNRLDWLDALRGWAVLGVLAIHSVETAHTSGWIGIFAGTGQYGVQLFFFVSALTISLTYDAHIARYGQHLRSQCAWLLKRFFRIAPLYYLAAGFYPLERLAVYTISHHRYGASTHFLDILANLLFIHTWVPSANNAVVPGGWSIGVEMFFYLLVPFIWLVSSIRRRVILLGLAVIGFLALTLTVSWISTKSIFIEDNSYLYYWFPTQAPVILLGLIFYFSFGHRLQAPAQKRISVPSFLTFLIFVFAAFYLGTVKEIAPAFAPTLLAVAFVFLVLSLQGNLKRVVANRYAIFLGKISFSVYILHFVILDLLLALFQILHLDRSSSLWFFAVFLLVLSITSVCALLSKRFVEDPAIAYGHKLSRALTAGKM